MASTVSSLRQSGAGPLAFLAPLARADRAIAGPRADALLFWGAPGAALVVVIELAVLAAALPGAAGGIMAHAMAMAMAIVTYAHLIAVVPRAYLNREVLAAHRWRLTLVPVLLVAALLLSPVALAIGVVVAVFWDVHHTAMQNFGLGRIYDMKAGNDATALRRTDLLLNAALYIGPAAAGAAMVIHFDSFERFGAVGWTILTRVPAFVAGAATGIQAIAIAVWFAVVGAALAMYRRGAARGYAVSAHKVALLLSTAMVSILAWGFAPPALAFMIVNLFHAVQYFALVWLKEGERMRALAPRAGRWALPAFLVACALFGGAYELVGQTPALRAGAWLAPFVACSLLHFWFDAFIWSVRRKLVR